MFKNWDWEDSWLALLYGLIITAFIGLSIFIISNKSTLRYSLGTLSGVPVIVKEIDNYKDEIINVDRNIPLDSIVVIISKLNNTLNKK
jgi:hypothetical protein